MANNPYEYVVNLTVAGFVGPVCVKVCSDVVMTRDEITACALETLSQAKENDADVVSIYNVCLMSRKMLY